MHSSSRTVCGRSLPLLAALLVALLLCSPLVLFAAGCGAQTQLIPSALDTQAIDIEAEPGPAELPPRSTGVPADSLLETLQWIARSDGRQLESQRWWDFENDRFRWDTFGDPAFIGGGTSTTANDPANATILFSAVSADGRTISFDAFTSELRSSPEQGQPAAEDTMEEWGTADVVRLGRQILSSTEVDVYRLDLNVPRGQERMADFGLVYVDAASGLRLREEWLLGSPGDAWVYHLFDYRLVPRTPEAEARLTAQALIDLAGQSLEQKLQEVAGLDFPVWGLPEGAHGLVLSGITVDGTQVSLAYVPEGYLGPAAVSVETNDIRGRSDFPERMLISRDEAVAHSEGADHIDFRMKAEGTGSADGYDTAVRVLLGSGSGGLGEPLALGTVAMDLVDVRSTGHSTD
jgi:hypothetical protein